MTLLANAIKDWTARLFGEETGTQILISLLLPFGSYVVADRLGASGILAAVTAGIAMSYEELAERALAVRASAGPLFGTRFNLLAMA